MLLKAFLRASALAITTSASCYNSYCSPTSFDLPLSHHPAWMTTLPDSTPLSFLSIPGTHDTMTYNVTDPVFQCNNHNLKTQLNAGLRYFDIRGRLVRDEIHVYHSVQDTGFSLTDVVGVFEEFLGRNPGEGLIVRLKEEIKGINSTLTFEEAFKRYLLPNSTTPMLSSRLYKPSNNTGSSFTPFFPLPTLSSIRSRIFLLQNFPSNPPNAYGLSWETAGMSLEDLWAMQNMTMLNDKFTVITENIDAARSDSSSGKLYLTHLSASVGVLPISAAAGEGNITGINDRVAAWLTNNIGTTGVVVMDFPGKELIDLVLSQN